MTTPISKSVDIESAPWYGYDSIESYGDPWDAYLKDMDVDGVGCSNCGNGCGGSLVDDFTDDGHRMAMRWRWMTLILQDGEVKPLCEDCSMELLPPS